MRRDENATRFAYQVSPSALPSAALALYAEAGIGASGSILAGVRYRFDPIRC